MLRLASISAVLVLAICQPGAAQAQPAPEPHWIWHDTGSAAPAAAVWFRNEYKAYEPSTGAIFVVGPRQFTVWANGQQLGTAGGPSGKRFSLSGIVGRGTNVIAIRAESQGGLAGIYIDGEIRGQTGAKIPFVSAIDWKSSTQSPTGEAWLKPGFTDKNWKFVKDLGRHGDSPFKQKVTIPAKELDRFDVPAGFTVHRVAEPQLVGSLIAMTWGNRGRLLVSREQGPILSLFDSNGDGKFDKSVEVSSQIHTCQGLCQVGDNLYAVGKGPQGTGIYRLPDANHDDVADSIQPVTLHNGGMSEHGPHAVVLGPDGFLYHCMGNHAWLKETPQATTPCRNYAENYLLEPRFEDAGGHAVGIKAPGGTIWRFSRDGKKWWLETNGFRNEYDIAFTQRGNLFSFDSDMEWDVGLPWYRPVRVNFCQPGAEFGWRSGAAKTPAYNFDTLPAALDVGRGSPTGVVFYEHTQFPESYRGSLLCCDWSMGRILACPLTPQGAGFSGTSQVLITGNPLNVSDIEVDRDGSVLFCTGGRKTEGGVYRLSYTGNALPVAAAKPAAVSSVPALLNLPQPQANWNREQAQLLQKKLGPAWAEQLQSVVRSGAPLEKVRALTLLAQQGPAPSVDLLVAAAKDSSPTVRQFATLLLGSHSEPQVGVVLTSLLSDPDLLVRRRACEAFVRSGGEAPVNAILPLLGHSDRWLRFAARIALERISPAKWRTLPAGSAPLVELNWLLARSRSVPQEASLAETAAHVRTILASAQTTPEIALDALRMLQLSLIAQGTAPRNAAVETQLQAIGSRLSQEFTRWTGAATPAGEHPSALPLKMELSRTMSALQVPGTVPAILLALTKSQSQAEQTHYALCLRYVRQGWGADAQQKYLQWYEQTGNWEGGNSLQGYLRNIVAGTLDHFSPADRKKFVLGWKQYPLSAKVIISVSEPRQIADYELVTHALIGEVEAAPSGASQQELVLQIIDALGRNRDAGSQSLLRKLFDSHADQQNQIARSLSKNPTAENVPYLLRALRGGDRNTMQVTLDALRQSNYKPTTADDYRHVILAGLKLGKQGGVAAVRLLGKWTGQNPAGSDKDIAAALTRYQKWYVEKYPDALPPELPPSTSANAKFSFQEIVDYLDRDPRGKQGDAVRGKVLFTKINCVKCHRFGTEGAGVGPDLTSVRRRFQRKEIVESILYPSLVVSDQYRALTVETKAGLSYSGLRLPNPGVGDKLILLLSDATRMEIPGTEIDFSTPSKTSVMPEALLKDLSLAEIADLFAYLETSKNAPEPAGNQPAAGQPAAAPRVGGPPAKNQPVATAKPANPKSGK